MRSIGQSQLARTQGSNSGNTQNEQNRRKLVAYLENALKEESQKRQQAQKALLEYRKRSLNAQKQFSRILQKYQNSISIVRGNKTYSQQIWQRLINQIQNFNDNSQRMLEKRCNQILYIMNRKINQILEKTDHEISKSKKLSEEEYKSVREQIKEALNLAKEIEQENDEIKKMNKELVFKVNILREEKNLLVQQINQKKMLIGKMKQSYIVQTPRSTSAMSPRPRSTRITASELTKPPKFIGEPSYKGQSSIEDPQEPSTNRKTLLSKEKGLMLAKTDSHFKICLEREKRKNAQLKGIVAKLHAKCAAIGDAIQASSKELKKGSSQTQLQKKLMRLVEQIRVKLIMPKRKEKEMSSSQLQLMSLIQY